MEDNIYYAEPAFFSMFHFEWLNGSPKDFAERILNNAVLTQATAEKYFGNWKDALGKTIMLDNKTPYIVTGILKNVPANSDFPLRVVVPYSAFRIRDINNNLTDWVSTFGGAYTFIVLPTGLSATEIQCRVSKPLPKNINPQSIPKTVMSLQPLTRNSL